jgi:hypothetical protein
VCGAMRRPEMPARVLLSRASIKKTALEADAVTHSG